MTKVPTNHNISRRKRVEKILWESLAQLSKKNKYQSIISTVTRGVHESINLADVLENAVESLSKNMDGVENVSIYLVEGDGEEFCPFEWTQSSPVAVLKSHRGYDEHYVRQAGRIPYPKGTTWKTIINGKPRYVADADKDAVIGSAGREMGTKSYVSMPVHFGGKTVGVININSLMKNAFDEEELTLLENVARQIEIAIDNAKTVEALRRSEESYRHAKEELEIKVKDLEILTNLIRAVHQYPGLDEIYSVALDSVKELENIDMAMIYLVDEKTNEAVIQAHRNLPEGYLKSASRIPYPRGATWKAINSELIVNIEDAQKDLQIGPAGRRLGHHSVLGIPISENGKGVGVIWFLSYKERKFTQRDVNLLSALGNQIATAIAKAKLFEELKAANEKLSQLDIMKDEFISMASHELRTPLTAISSFVSMLLEGDYGSLPSEAVEALTDVNTATNRLISLTDYMLDVPRIEQRRLGFEISDFDIGEVCEGVINSLMPMAQEKGLRIEYQRPPAVGRLMVSADRLRVEQVIINLVGNALKFTEKGGVALTHRIGDGLIITDVIDTGIGIAEKDQELLFRKFRAINHSLSKDYKGGIGLGLYISKLLLNEMGGYVRLEKSKFASGSTFSFSLPSAITNGNDKTIVETAEL